MKFHIAAGGLLVAIVCVFYFILRGFHQELADARPQIEKESFKAAQGRKQKPAEPEPSAPAPLDERILNHDIKTPAPLPTKPARPKEAPVDEITDRLEGQDYWCRPTEVIKDKNPVRCEYMDSCFSCKNSDVIPPEVPTATPFCKDGSRAEVYSVECCPTNVGGNDFSCPAIQDCMKADNVPSTFCTCGEGPNCKYVVIGDKIECACIRE